MTDLPLPPVAHRPPRGWSRRHTAGLCMAAALTGCGGGDDGGGCETVSAGSTRLTIRNSLGNGVRAFMPALSFGADMVAGECIVVGYDARGTNGLRVDAQQCRNSGSDSRCDGRLFGPTRVLTVPIAAGGESTLTIDGATFAAVPGSPR